jgi:Asp-tRNA(Asn)/Glu-tRNA(Gln) amidotransferase A subunit family amidase
MGVFYPKRSPSPPGLQVSKTNNISDIAKESVRWPALKVSEKLRSGQLSVTAYARALLERQDDLDVRAWVPCDNKLLETAAGRDTRGKRVSGPPLWSCPIAVKDIFATKGAGSAFTRLVYSAHAETCFASVRNSIWMCVV